MLLSLPRVGGGQYKTHSSSLKLEIQLQTLSVGQNTERDWRMNEFPHILTLTNYQWTSSTLSELLHAQCFTCSSLRTQQTPVGVRSGVLTLECLVYLPSWAAPLQIENVLLVIRSSQLSLAASLITFKPRELSREL